MRSTIAPKLLRRAMVVACALLLLLACGCGGATQDHPVGQPTLPDTSQARPYYVDSSNIQLVKQGEEGFTFDQRLFEVAGKSVSVAVTTRGAWQLPRTQRAHTAMKAAHDIQRATGAESVLLYLLLDAGLPKFSYSVATVAYAPGGRNWNDGHGVEVWDVEVSGEVFSREQVEVIQASKLDGSSPGKPSMLLPISRRRFDLYRQPEVASDPAPAPPSPDTQLFTLVSPIVTSEERGRADEREAALALSLIAQGANVNATDGGETPLHLAARNGHLGVTRVLLDKGAKVNAQDERGETPLLRAASAGDVEMVRLLLSKGADPNIKTKDGFNALTAIEGPDDPQTRAIRRMLGRAGAK